MRYPSILISALLLLSYGSTAQKSDTVTFRFVPTFNKEVVQLGQNYFLKSLKDSVLFKTLKFYVSKPERIEDKTLTHKSKPAYWLVDLEKPSSLEMQIVLPENSDFKTLYFFLGVDNVTSNSGAHGGDLDPTKGMYWTWQSGYVNFKLEGKSNSCPARKNLFQYHIGGYQKPFNAIQEVELNVEKSEAIIINIALDNLLDEIDITKNFQIMSPNEKAMNIANFLPSVFSVSQ